MRVCFLAPFNPRESAETKSGGHLGGVERYSDCLTRALAAKGAEVTLVCSGDSDSVTESDGVRIVQRKRIGIFLRTPISLLHREFLGDFDVFHVPATYPTYSEVLPLVAKLRDTPCVLDYHFDVPPFGAARTLAPVYYALARRSFAHADRIILKSHGYERSSPGLKGLANDAFRVIPNGVDTTLYHPAPNPTRDYFLFVGRLVRFKGVDVLLDALSRVDDSLRLPLRVVGTGPMREELEAKAASLGVEAEFCGYVDNETLAEHYRNARATILPSLTNQESFGMTLVESMASGTPVVASDLMGTRYAWRFGGALFPPGNARALADLLARHARTAPEPAGPALARRIHDAYAWDRIASKMLQVYDEAATDRRRARAWSEAGMRRARGGTARALREGGA